MRVGLLVGAVSLILSGVATLQNEHLHYPNYWGGSVFAPFAIVLGVALLVVVVVRRRPLEGPHSRFRGKAARRQQKALEKRPPIETFDKPWNR